MTEWVIIETRTGELGLSEGEGMYFLLFGSRSIMQAELDGTYGKGYYEVLGPL